MLGLPELNTGRRAVALRAHFMEALLGDPRVVRLLAGWIERLSAHPKAFNTDDVLPLVTSEVGLRWPWCVVGILEAFHRMVLLKSADPVHLVPPMEAAVYAPPLALWFAPKYGESTDEARARLKGLYVAAMAELDAADTDAAGGRAPKGDAHHLRSWARWYYERHVARPRRDITSIAKENHKTEGHPARYEDCDCRKKVRDGIAEAKRLLNLGEYVFPGPGGGKAPPLSRQ